MLYCLIGDYSTEVSVTGYYLTEVEQVEYETKIGMEYLLCYTPQAQSNMVNANKAK